MQSRIDTTTGVIHSRGVAAREGFASRFAPEYHKIQNLAKQNRVGGKVAKW